MEEDGTTGIGWSRAVKVQPEVRERDSNFVKGTGAPK